MLFALVVLLGALVIGYGAGGRLERLGQLGLRRGVLVVLALLAQLGGGVVGGPVYRLGLVVSAVLVAIFLTQNARVQGTGLVALGLLSNALVVGLNGAMPVSGDASGRAGIETRDVLSGADPGTSSPAGIPTCGGSATSSRCCSRCTRRWSASATSWWQQAWASSSSSACPAAEPYSARVPGLELSVNRSTLRSVAPLRRRQEETLMAKKGRKRRARKKSKANHGKRPNA